MIQVLKFAEVTSSVSQNKTFNSDLSFHNDNQKKCKVYN